MKKYTEEDVWAKIEVNDCWDWQGSKINGYGDINFEGKRWKAHRLVWILLVGEIPIGLVLDHVCRNKGCVNPDHLEPVTDRENIRRGGGGRKWWEFQANKTHCPHGHPYSGDNLIVRQKAKYLNRICRACEVARNKARRLPEKSAQ